MKAESCRIILTGIARSAMTILGLAWELCAFEQRMCVVEAFVEELRWMDVLSDVRWWKLVICAGKRR